MNRGVQITEVIVLLIPADINTEVPSDGPWVGLERVGHQLVSPVLKPLHDLANKSTLDSIRLHHDKSAFLVL
ncbi:hypothetical protein MAR_022239, partial [Mya arenaria]